jgi:transposase
MSIVAAPPETTKSTGHFRLPPWHDQHPARQALAAAWPADHLAYRIEAAVAALDLTAVRAAYGGTGSAAYPPEFLLRVVLFATARGEHSPAHWYRAAQESGPCRWLLRGWVPGRSTWYSFRDRLAPLLRPLNGQPLHQAVAQGLTTATRGANDGTVIAAHASRHRLRHAGTLAKHLVALDAQLVADDAAEAGPTEAGPTDAGPTEARPAWMARLPATRRAQRQRYRRAQALLAQRQAQQRHQAPSKRTPAARLVISVADPEAALGLDKEDVYRPLYNVQLLDDLDSPFLLGYEVFAQASDAGLLGTMLQRTQELTGRRLHTVLADSTYANGPDLRAAADAGVTVYAPPPAESAGRQLPKSAFAWLPAAQTYVCPQGHRLELEATGAQQRAHSAPVRVRRYRCPPAHCTVCPLQQACARNPAAGRTVSRSEHEELLVALRARLVPPAAQQLYRRRRETVELVNADWKAHRGLRRFSGRGLTRVRCQVALVVLTHNLLTLHAAKPPNPPATDAASALPNAA